MDLPKTPAEFADRIRPNQWEIGDGGDDGLPSEGLLETGAAIAAGVGTRLMLTSLWKRTRGSEPPRNPAVPGTTWTDALLWAASVGAAIGVARVLARRGTAMATRRSRC